MKDLIYIVVSIMFLTNIAQSAEAVELTDCFSTKG